MRTLRRRLRKLVSAPASVEVPPPRFCLLGRWYRLTSVSGHAWQAGEHPSGPLVYTYHPVDPDTEASDG